MEPIARKELFGRALRMVKQAKSRHPDYFWEGIERQLEYLIALTKGETSDRSRLGDINIGILTVREIEGLDDELASTLHNVSNEADNMRWD